MRNIYRSLLLVLAGATQKELIRQNRYLKIENRRCARSCRCRLQFTAGAAAAGALSQPGWAGRWTIW